VNGSRAYGSSTDAGDPCHSKFEPAERSVFAGEARRGCGCEERRQRAATMLADPAYESDRGARHS
jgi:hypothetical protein